MVSDQSSMRDDVYSIKDPMGQIKILASLIFFVSLFLWVLYKYWSLKVWEAFHPSYLLPLVIIMLFIAVSYYRLKAIWKGVELNLSNRTMSFPGGGISANGIGDYISPTYQLQHFKRKTIALDAISEIAQETIKHTKRKDGVTSVSYTHYIKFVGTFGAARVQFSSEGKRDELYNAIRQANRMGTPVFDAA